MELFLAVCEYKSINQAAEAYYVSQQGISKMIRDLEAELGCNLLHRTQKGVAPTQQGMYFLGECRSMLEKKESVCSNITSISDYPQEIIHLGMAFGMISTIPYRLILDFEAQYPYIKIDYSDHTDFYLESLLKKGDYDFCVTTGVLDSDNIMGEQWSREDLFLAIPMEHSLFSQPEITMEDLEHQAFAMFTTQFHIRHNFEAACAKAGFSPIIEISSNDFNSLREIAIQNNLLFVVPQHTVLGVNPKLRYVPFPDSNFHWGIYFAKKKNKSLNPNMQLFYTYLKAQLGIL